MPAMSSRSLSRPEPPMHRLVRPRSLPFWLAGCVFLLAWLAACAPAERPTQLADLARWQDQRLAPVDSLTALLAAGDAHVRRAALRAAGLIGRSDVLPAMLEALADRSLAVRREAAFSLGLLGNEAAIEPLTRLLADPHPAVREAAIGGLSYLKHDGSMLYGPALRGKTSEAGAAWTALRHAAGRADRDSLLAAVRAGLARTESAVRWRVLRCAELVPDSTLIAQIAPYVTDSDVEVRIHALRALARQTGPAALAAVLQGHDDHGRLRGRDLVRVRIAEQRALGNLAQPALAQVREDDHDTPGGRSAAVLGRGVTDANPAIARTALMAAAAAVQPLALPPQAAQQESLLPVWRLRLARQVRDRLDDPAPAIRAAACEALGAVRGAGALAELTRLLTDADPTVGTAAFTALLRLSPQHDQVCDWIAALTEQHGQAAEALVLPALPALIAQLRAQEALAAPVTRFPRRQDPACLPSLAWWLAARALQSDDQALRAQAAPMLGELPGEMSRRAVLAAWRAEQARGDAEVRLALLKAMASLFAEEPAGGAGLEFSPRRQECLFFARTSLPPAAAGFDSLLADRPERPDRTAAAAALTEAFADGDLRLRLAAREAALATGLLPEPLIPSAASLRETLPAHQRDSDQPAVALPSAKPPRVRCVTERGVFELRLEPQNAPTAVAAFLGLIERGFHRDLTFHRLVEDFVIQGGCPRGDGWGDPGWTLRCEYSPQPFGRGTVGIAHAGKDTGGSQWFVCLSPQPHLDGRYTVLGEVTRGLEVLDRIERGDRYRLEIIAF